MNNTTCDMHTHTNNSDGMLTTAALLSLSNSLNLTKLSITDHDSVKSYFDIENLELSSLFKGEILCGCEFNCQIDWRPIEILGYGIDYKAANVYLKKYGITQNVLDKNKCIGLLKVIKERNIDFSFNLDEIDFTVTNPKAFKSYMNKRLKTSRLLHYTNQKTKLLFHQVVAC